MPVKKKIKIPLDKYIQCVYNKTREFREIVRLTPKGGKERRER